MSDVEYFPTEHIVDVRCNNTEAAGAIVDIAYMFIQAARPLNFMASVGGSALDGTQSVKIVYRNIKSEDSQEEITRPEVHEYINLVKLYRKTHKQKAGLTILHDSKEITDG
jgi:hypothetical protein